MPGWRSEPAKHNDDKGIDASKRVEELKQDLAQLYRDRFDLINQEYSDRIDRIDHELDMLDARIEEEAYTMRSSDFNQFDSGNAYNQQIQRRSAELDLLKKKEEDLKVALQEAIGSGYIKEGSEEWHAMVGEIESVEKQAKDTAKEIRETYDKMFDAISEKFDGVIATAERAVNKLNHNIDLSYYTGGVKEYGKLIEQYSIEYANHMARAQELQAALDKRADLVPGSKAWLEEQEKVWSEIEAAEQAQLDIHSTYVDQFDDIQTRYETALGALDDEQSILQGKLDEIEARGYMGGVSLYEGLIESEEQKIRLRIEERKSLEEALAKSVAEGAIEEGSAAWFDARKNIDDVTAAIQEATKQTLEYRNALRQLEWDKFDYARDRVADITEETEFLVKLMSRSKLFDDNGKFTNEGTATMGMYALNFNVYSEQARAYAEEIERLNKDIADDPNNTKLLDRRRELLKSHRDAILAAQEEKESVRDLVKDGIEAQIDAMQKLVDEYEKTLDSQKD